MDLIPVRRRASNEIQTQFRGQFLAVHDLELCVRAAVRESCLSQPGLLSALRVLSDSLIIGLRFL